MEAKIQEVKEYFKNKILEGDFKLIDIEQYECTLLIDSKYPFQVWLGNFETPHLRFVMKSSFMNIDLNDAECIYLHNLIQFHIRHYRNLKLIDKKLQEVRDLKAELLDSNDED